MNDLLSGRRVLVVEDEMMVLMTIEDMLADLGCTMVCVASTVGAALKLLSETARFDMAMLDVNLGKETSYPVADALVVCGTPFLFSTGYGESRVDARFGGRPVIKKPYGDADFRSAVTQLMATA